MAVKDTGFHFQRKVPASARQIPGLAVEETGYGLLLSLFHFYAPRLQQTWRNNRNPKQVWHNTR